MTSDNSLVRLNPLGFGERRPVTDISEESAIGMLAAVGGGSGAGDAMAIVRTVGAVRGLWPFLNTVALEVRGLITCRY